MERSDAQYRALVELAELMKTAPWVPDVARRAAVSAIDEAAFCRLPPSGTEADRARALFEGARPVRTIEVELRQSDFARLARFTEPEDDETLEDALKITISAALDCGLREWETDRRLTVDFAGEVVE